jgi:predicted metal-dependent HD superfamily phosphohydrolase
MLRMNDWLRQAWHDLLSAWSVDSILAEQALEDVVQHYSGPGRFYHTLDHIQNVLETVETLRAHAANLNAVKLAAWLHDVIYDSKASDNEERSARYAERLCEKLSIPDGRLVAALILKTKTHDGDDADSQVLTDADLAILAETESVYRRYAEQIRQEYAWVPEPEYRAGRRRILEHFLNKSRIYHFLSSLEDRARRNICR